jgi:hypothetical protein
VLEWFVLLLLLGGLQVRQTIVQAAVANTL